MKSFALTFGLILAAVAASAQSVPVLSTNSQQISAAAGPDSSTAIMQREDQVRAACIEGRRLICGRILEVLPDGLVVESGYTNLLREPLSRSWLIPSTAQASRADNLIESKTPGAICVGRIFLTNTPKTKRLKPAKYDYVIVQAYPAGQFDYQSSAGIHRTIRRFSANVLAAVQANLESEKK